MTTKKDILIEKYTIMINNIKIHTDIKIFPDINDFELYEILYYFKLYFFNYEDSYTTIKNIITEKNLDITDDILILIFPYIKEFLDFIHKFYFKSESVGLTIK